MATRLDGPKADGKTLTLSFIFTDVGESHVLTLENSVLHHLRRPEPDPAADATVRLTKDFFLRLVTRQAGLREMIFSDDFAVDGSRLDLLTSSRCSTRRTGRFPSSRRGRGLAHPPFMGKVGERMPDE
jgi:alkyl sulfatase BDS1-like metallo-beta-lactamase superfamily hydrolase